MAKEAGVPANGGLSPQSLQFWMGQRAERSEIFEIHEGGPGQPLPPQNRWRDLDQLAHMG